MASELEVFAEALALTEVKARDEFLDRIYGTDQDKRRRMNELLKLHETTDSVLERTPQQLFDSLSGDNDHNDHVADPQITLASLQPYLEPSARPDSLGRLGHYELMQILGQGGYGIVFKAQDVKLERLVAVKIQAPHLAVASPARRRFIREARAAAAVRHENVIQIYAVEEQPIPYLVMEFVSGETLQQRSDRLGPFSADEVVRIGRQIARGLTAAHECGLIHRDIKPGNILIEDGIEPIAKLTDFGLARTADDASRSQSGMILGTPMYMSPEQISDGKIDLRSDLFSFGSVLYLMASGRPPFRATSTLAVLKRVAHDKPRSIRDVMPDVPTALCDVIAKLHAKSRERRFSTATEVEAALTDCLKPRSIWSLSSVRKTFLSSRKTAVTATVTIAILVTCGLLMNSALNTTKKHSGHSIVTMAEDQGDHHNAVNPGNLIAPAVSNQNQMITRSSVPVKAAREQAPAEMAKRPMPTSNQTATNTSLPAATTKTPMLIDELSAPDWERTVARLAPEDQATAVCSRLKQLNPDFETSHYFPHIENGVVSQLRIQPANNITDFSPVRALQDLKSFRVFNGGGLTQLDILQGMKLNYLEIVGNEIRDLSPLKGMPLHHLGLWPFMGNDLTPIAGMKLRGGNLGGGLILRDISTLRGMPFDALCLNHTEVSDISALKGMPLNRLEIQNTHVTDLSPLYGMKLEFLGLSGSFVTDLKQLQQLRVKEITIDYDNLRDRDIVEAIPDLEIVNGKPLAEFLASQ